MPFQYETFEDGQPLNARQIQKTSNNQFELYETYKERGRGLVGKKMVPATGGQFAVVADDASLLSRFQIVCYPDRYYLVEASLGRAEAAAGWSSYALQLQLKIDGIHVSTMNSNIDSTTTASSTGLYVNHIWQSPSDIPAKGRPTMFALWVDDVTELNEWLLSYASSSYQGRIHLYVIDMGSSIKGNYYG